MQILVGVFVLAIVAAMVVLAQFGVARIERRAARWLLLDARGWDAREAERRNSRAAVWEVR